MAALILLIFILSLHLNGSAARRPLEKRLGIRFGQTNATVRSKPVTNTIARTTNDSQRHYSVILMQCLAVIREEQSVIHLDVISLTSVGMPLVEDFENTTIRRMVFISRYALESENASVPFICLNGLLFQTHSDEPHDPGPISLC